MSTRLLAQARSWKKIPTANLWGWWHAGESYSDTTCTTLQTTNGGAVAGLKDLSGNGRNLIQATGAQQPVYTTGALNSLPSAKFNAKRMQWNGTTPQFPFSIYFIAKLNSGQNADRHFMTFNSGTGNGRFSVFRIDSANPTFRSQIVGGQSMVRHNSLPFDTFFLASYACDTADYYGFRDTIAGSVPTPPPITTLTARTNLAIGGDSGFLIDMDLCELLIYDAFHTKDEMSERRIRRYLSTKYGRNLAI